MFIVDLSFVFVPEPHSLFPSAVLRTETLGYLTIEFHTIFKDFQSLGYDSSIGHSEL